MPMPEPRELTANYTPEHRELTANPNQVTVTCVGEQREVAAKLLEILDKVTNSYVQERREERALLIKLLLILCAFFYYNRRCVLRI